VHSALAGVRKDNKCHCSLSSNEGTLCASKNTDGPKTTDTGKRSIAVLPFINMSSDQEQEWFAYGLTEEISNSLARTPDHAAECG